MANNEEVKLSALSLKELLFGGAGVKLADGGTRFHPENCAVIDSIKKHFTLPFRSVFHLYYIQVFFKVVLVSTKQNIFLPFLPWLFSTLSLLKPQIKTGESKEMLFLQVYFSHVVKCHYLKFQSDLFLLSCVALKNFPVTSSEGSVPHLIVQQTL